MDPYFDRTGHLTAQFPELEAIISNMEGDPGSPIKHRHVRVRFRNGCTFEGDMRSEHAERFIDGASKSPNVVSYMLGEEI